MKFFSLEAVLCVSHIMLNEKIIFYHLNLFHSSLISAPSIAHIVNRLYGSSSYGDPLGDFLKNRGSPILALDAQIQPIMK